MTRRTASFAGLMVSMLEDRLYAHLNGLADGGAASPQVIAEITPFWEESLAAWASGDPRAHDDVDREIPKWRKRHPWTVLPFATRRSLTLASQSTNDSVLP